MRIPYHRQRSNSITLEPRFIRSTPRFSSGINFRNLGEMMLSIQAGLYIDKPQLQRLNGILPRKGVYTASIGNGRWSADVEVTAAEGRVIKIRQFRPLRGGLE